MATFHCGLRGRLSDQSACRCYEAKQKMSPFEWFYLVKFCVALLVLIAMTAAMMWSWFV